MNISTKSYESLLPFLVVEATASQTSSLQSMSVLLMDKGWAWLVCGRRLLVWKFKESKSQTITTRSRRTLSPSFELQLPQADLKHKAELINVFFLPQNPNTSMRTITIPAALSVSPEGIIRFWSSVANERFTELTVADIQGQEFCTLENLSPTEYLLGTTTGSVYLLKIDMETNDARGPILCSPLTSQSGLLSGIGRRVTNLFFGPMASDAKSEFRKPLFAVNPTDKTFFILGSAFKLRQWCRTNDGSTTSSQLVREWDLHKKLQKKLSTVLGVSNPEGLQIWPVDMISTRSKELLILVSTLDTTRGNTVNYATVVFNPYQAGDRISKTTVMRSHSWQYTNGCEEQLFALRFVERCASSPVCFLYDRKFLFLAQVDVDILDAIDYANQDDGILGAGFVDKQVMLFTLRDGLVSCTATKRQQDDEQEDNNRVGNSTMNSTRPFCSETIHEDSQMTTLDATETSEKEQSRVEHNERSRDTASASRPLNQSSKENKPNEEADLMASKEFEWIQHLDNKRYGLASSSLAKLAEDSKLLHDRKETLLALSKLAKICE